MEVGDTRSELVHIGDGMPTRQTGKVVYIHPKRRFYTVEFRFDGGSFRESYFFSAHGRIDRDDR